MGETELQNMYIKCATTQAAKAGCGAKAAVPKCCDAHTSAVNSQMSQAESEGFLMDLYHRGHCEENYLVELYDKCDHRYLVNLMSSENDQSLQELYRRCSAQHLQAKCPAPAALNILLVL